MSDLSDGFYIPTNIKWLLSISTILSMIITGLLVPALWLNFTVFELAAYLISALISFIILWVVFISILVIIHDTILGIIKKVDQLYVVSLHFYGKNRISVCSKFTLL